MAKIHPQAIVHAGAELDYDVEVGPFSIIGPHVRIGSGTRIHSSVVIDGWTTIGYDNEIYSGAVVGLAPQDLRYTGGRSYVRIGNRNVIREYVSIHRASDPEGETVVGDGNLLMGYVHVAHNCRLGNQIIMANYVGLCGHVEVEDQAVLGGMAGVHQFVRVGRLSMVGGMAKVTKDVPPFALVDGQPARLYGINIRGLQRRGLTREARQAIKQAFRLILQSGLNLRQAIDAIRQTVPPCDEVRHLLSFLESPSRMGVMSRSTEEAVTNGRLKSRAAGNGRLEPEAAGAL
ncbi:MAG TPA: acyl-ACP--UDP-N-acetylglucosamine O-acyltransferase [Candidatus Nitrosotenuis sp.]|jgi:UDP-N-acetylglucosamine acyltransferase|nr:acyl-ACP--UDP-N-acetylglucosamine O-acyltransferase [Candidatus Nitrosotenuis sp.]